jgi:hypothetical protein
VHELHAVSAVSCGKREQRTGRAYTTSAAIPSVAHRTATDLRTRGRRTRYGRKKC